MRCGRCVFCRPISSIELRLLLPQADVNTKGKSGAALVSLKAAVYGQRCTVIKPSLLFRPFPDSLRLFNLSLSLFHYFGPFSPRAVLWQNDSAARTKVAPWTAELHTENPFSAAGNLLQTLRRLFSAEDQRRIASFRRNSFRKKASGFWLLLLLLFISPSINKIIVC